MNEGSIMYGICDICGKESILKRKYYNYHVKCQCHSPYHFEIVEYCSNCTPIEPYETKLFMKTSDVKRLNPLFYLIPCLILIGVFTYLFIDYTKKLEKENMELKRFTDSIIYKSDTLKISDK